MPWPERYEIPASTVRAVNDARARGGRVIAVGTSVVRALEGCVQSHGALRAGEGVTALRIDARLVRRVVDGLLTGMHDPGSSHFDLLGAFAHDDVLRAAHAEAEQRGYRAHEFGDSALILDGVLDDRAMTLHTAA
jgi:S-adenosylmethionine:tRNA ribosyltransferase-isomerase